MTSTETIPQTDTLGVSGHADPEGEAPWALQMVVRAEKNDLPTTTDVLEAAAKAVVMLLASPHAAPGGEWEPALNRWLAGRIRKICKRARGAAWEKAAALPGATATVRSATVRAFVPCPTDQVPAEIAKLQVQGLDTEDPAPVTDPVTVLAVACPDTLVIAVNPELTMSTGKTAAQVAHASNVAWLDASPQRRRAWAARGFPTVVTRPAERDFRRFSTLADVEIHDAGFTEIASGSLTTVARWS